MKTQILTQMLRCLGRLLLWPATLVVRPVESGKDEPEVLLGGQAVIEGVMMRSPHSFCVAVRTPAGSIAQRRDLVRPPADRWRGWGWPGLRGLATLGQSLALGVRALRFSAQAALDTSDAVAAAPSTAPPKKMEASDWLLGVNLVLSLVFFLFLFKYAPLWVATQLEGRGWVTHWLAFNLADGLVRLALFVAFLWLMSRWRDMRRIFEYHGAEHMVVYNWESGRPVTLEHARQFPPAHPRCGTSFLLVVLLLSLLAYAFVPVEGFGGRLLLRIALLPLLAAAAYEVIRAAAKSRNWLWRAAVAPGLWVQKHVTTRLPADDQLEVAIRALEGALELERVRVLPVSAAVN